MRLSFSTNRRPRLTTKIVGPVYVTFRSGKRPRLHWLISGRGCLFGRSLFPTKR